MILNRRHFVHSLAAVTAAIPATRLWADTSSIPAVTVGGKQITLAAKMYQNDFGKGVEYDNPGGLLWMETLIQYYSNVRTVRLCPAAPEPNPVPSGGVFVGDVAHA